MALRIKTLAPDIIQTRLQLFGQDVAHRTTKNIVKTSFLHFVFCFATSLHLFLHRLGIMGKINLKTRACSGIEGGADCRMHLIQGSWFGYLAPEEPSVPLWSMISYLTLLRRV